MKAGCELTESASWIAGPQTAIAAVEGEVNPQANYKIFGTTWSMKTNRHPLQGLWLCRLFLESDPHRLFRSIMELEDRREAEALAAATGKKFDGEEEGYLEMRKRVEEWLRAEAEKKGVHPE